MSRSAPALSRRHLLAGGAAVAVLGITASACSSSPQEPPPVDELEAQLKLARQDAELAAAAASPAPPPVAAALREVATERTQHAQALATEIDRVAGAAAPTETTTTTPTPPRPPPMLSDVVNTLRISAANASRLATTSSGYRAGLLGSIAASCTSAYTVGLSFDESEPAGTSAAPSPSSTSTSPTSAPGHDKAYDAALSDALTTEHAVIYGYGIVSAHCAPKVNDLVSSALRQHRERRDQVISMLTARSVSAPVAAAGYELPMAVNNQDDAAKLAARMEKDTAVAWRAVIEKARTLPDRGFGVTALTQSAVMDARWNQVLRVWPITTAFPGAAE